MANVMVVHGAQDATEVPGIENLPSGVELRFAPNVDTLRAALPGAQMMLGWSFHSKEMREAWASADELKWIHWCGAGVDAVLFDELANSEVTLTNSRGVFDRAMAEYTLGLIIAFAKHLPETLRFQGEKRWQHRLTEQLLGKRALVVGVGSIGREIAKVLGAFGLVVDGVGRRARDTDADFRKVHAVSELDSLLPEADFVVAITPSTAETFQLFGAKQFSAMPRSSYFINLARGVVADESALVAALQSGEIAGAGLDVFETEPLDAASPLWDMDNVIVSPHMSGDFYGFDNVSMEIFLDNTNRFLEGRGLRNVVDKVAGFVPST
jgi:phosphoglycerate dehydrogenase-like enzyme